MNRPIAVPQQRFTDLNQLSLSFPLGNFQSDILNWGYQEPRVWRNYLHTHSFFEICYAFEGQGLFRINQKEYQVHQGQVFIAKPGEMHEILSSKSTPLGIYFWSYTLEPHAGSVPEMQEVDLLLKTFLTSPCQVSNHVLTMQRTIDLLIEEVIQRGPAYHQMIAVLASKLLVDTVRAVMDIPQQRTLLSQQNRNRDDATVQIMVRYLHDNYHAPMTVRDLAAQVSLSERHCSRLFSRIMGRSIVEYLTMLRIEAASQLLLNSQHSLKEIAHMTGYPDVRYFSTLFHRQTGRTPTTFRHTRRVDAQPLPAEIYER